MITEFLIILFGDIPPLSMIEGAFLKYFGTILMVTHDPFSASFCERILFLKDGKIFNEIFRGEKSRKDFFNEILDILTLLGGEVGNVR